MKIFIYKHCVYNYLQTLMAHYAEDYVLTPRDSRAQRAIRSGYTGPKNNGGEPDTTGTDEIGVMIYPPTAHHVSYSGQWMNGQFDGQGTFLLANGNTYTGGFKDGELHGHGVYKHSNGMVREGEFVNDLQASGTLIDPVYTFQGTFLAGTPHTGTFTYIDGSVFTGRMESDMKRVGALKFLDGDVFSGTFEAQNGWKLNGYGEMIVNSGNPMFMYKGQMRNGVRHGKGTMQLMSGSRKGERYSAMFDMDVEVEGSKIDKATQGGGGDTTS
jgi:hypothetical protein